MASALEKINSRRLDNIEYAWPFLSGYVPPLDNGTEEQTVTEVDPGEWVYFCDFVVSLGQRVAPPDVGVFVNRLWANDELIFDRTESFAKPGTSFSFYDGAENQGEVYRGMHYRGLMTLVFRDFNVKDYGNNVPAITAELIDGTANDPTHNIAGTIVSWNNQPSPVGELHHARDFLIRCWFNPSYSNTFLMERIRLSTKTQSALKFFDFGHSTYGVDTSDPDVLRDTLVTFIPSLNLAVGQAGASANIKRLHDTNDTTIHTLHTLSGLGAWQGCIAFSVRNGAYTDWFVIGGSDIDNGLDIVVIKSNMLHTAWSSVATDAVRCLTVGASRPGTTDIYVTTDGQIERLTVGMSGSTGGFTAGVGRDTFYSAGVGETIRQAWYSPSAARLYVLSIEAGDAVMRALDASGAVVWTSDPFPAPAVTSLRTRTQETTSNLINGTLVIKQGLAAGATDIVTFVDLATGFVSDMEVPNNGTTANDAMPLFWDSVSQVIYASVPKYVSIGVFPEPSEDPDRYTAATVMRSYAVFAGYDTADVFTSGMDEMYLDGYVVGADKSLGQLSSEIGQLYGFNWIENAGQISFKANYDTGELQIDFTVPEARLARLENSSPNFFTVMRDSDQRYPAILSLTYFDGENDYKRGFQIVHRNGDPVGTMDSDQSLHLSLPLTINGDYALELLYAALYRAWTKNGYNLRLPSDFLALEAGDAIEFTAYGMTYPAVITQSRINADNTISVTLEEAAVSTYPVQVETQPTVRQPTKAAQPVRTVLLDIPSRNEGQNAGNLLNLLVLMAGYTPGRFNGAVLEMTDASNPTDWKTKAVVSRDQEAYIGTLTEELGTWLYPFETDTYNSIYIRLDTIPEEYMSDADDANLDAGANLIAVGEGSEVELIQFGSVEHIGDDIWRLFNLRRGRFGTEVFQDVRSFGTPVSFLDRAVMIQYSYEDYDGKVQFLYRAHSPTQPMWQVDTQRYIPMANSRKPYAPIVISVLRDGGTGDIVISWYRRARFENFPPDDYTNPGMLDELTEEYEVHIPALAGGTTRVITTSTTTATYTIGQQGEDGRAGTETSLTFAVYQSSVETIGIGFTNPQVRTVYPVGTALLGARFALGGATETDVVLELPDDVFVSAGFGLGGDMGADFGPIPATMGVDFEGGGEMAADIREPVYLGANMALGGSMAVDVVNTGVTYRYYRIYITAVEAGSTAAAVSEFEMYEDPYGPNVVGGGTASASSTFGSQTPARAFNYSLYEDGTAAGPDKWSANATTFPQWLKYDFGAGNEKEIKSVGLHFSTLNNTQRPTDFLIQGSNDNTNWDTLLTVSGYSWGDKRYQRFNLDGVSDPPTPDYGAHTYWRIFVTKIQTTTNSVSCAELEFRATAGGADQTSGGTPFALSNFTGEGAANAFDNNAATKWSSVDHGSYNTDYLGYQFASAVAVKEILYKARADFSVGTCPKNLVVQYADSSSGPWTTAWEVNSIANWTTFGEERTFTSPLP